MRYDKIQAFLWNTCTQLNDTYPPGSKLVVDGTVYSVAFLFNVVSNGLKANLLNVKTHKHVELIVGIIDQSDGKYKSVKRISHDSTDKAQENKTKEETT